LVFQLDKLLYRRDGIINQAIGREHPRDGLIVHTDRGAQYTSQHFQALLLEYGCQQSMSRKGNPYDNAVMESFYRTLKRELVHDANYDNPEQARMDIFKYIEFYYNTKRIHSTLGWLSPVQFESKNS
jgi:putative transposase